MPSIISNTSTNPLALAAENPPTLVPLLRSNPSLAAIQDEHGYSLLHAAASYNHLDLARCLKSEFRIDPNIVDEDHETALFVVESVEAAQCLLEDVGTDPFAKNEEGMTAEDKIRSEGDFVAVADYLREVRLKSNARGEGSKPEASGQVNSVGDSEHPPPLPPGIQLRVGSLEEEQNLGEVADPDLRRRIEELASRDDFQGEEGQRELRDLITAAVRGVDGDQRDVRRRID